MSLNFFQVFIHLVLGIGFSLEEDSRSPFWNVSNKVRNRFQLLYGFKGLVVHHFRSDNLFTTHACESNNRFGSIIQGWEEGQATTLVRYIFYGVVNDGGYETDSPFRTDEDVIQDIHDFIEINQGVEAITSGIFDFVFPFNHVHQFLVFHDVCTDFIKSFYDIRAGL